MARRGGFFWRIVDLAMMVLTLVSVLGLVFAYISPFVNPNTSRIFAYAGLAAPALFLANVFLMLYWAIRWKAAFILPALVLLIGVPKIKLFYRFSPGKEFTEPEIKDGIKVMTYNVEGFLTYDEQSHRNKSSAREIVDFIHEINPDILCLQEFQSTRQVPESTLNQWLEDWPHRKILYTISYNGREVFGPAIYSKFPILSHGEIRYEESNNGTLWVEVLSGKKDTIRVICNHLETTYIKKENLDFLQPGNFTNNPDKTGQLRQIAGKLLKGFRKRAHQADTVHTLISSRDLPTLVCGDFNDPPMSYSYKTIRDGYGDTFAEKGSGYGYTYKQLYRLMRIDYILRSPHLETLSYATPDAPWSDHRPVIAVLRIKQE